MTDLETEIRDALHSRVQDVTAERLRHAERDEVVIPLQAVVATRGHRIGSWFTAAAIAAALAIGATLGWSTLTDGTPSGGRPDASPIMASDRLTLPFALEESSGYRIVHVAVGADGETAVDLADPSHRLMLVLLPEGSAGQDQHDVSHVDINGLRATYSEDLVDNTVGAASGSPTASPRPSAPTATPAKYWTRHLQWDYAPKMKVLLQPFPEPLGGGITKDELLAAARGIDFTHTTPLRSPFRLTSPPMGQRLSDVGVDFGTDHEVAGYRIAAGWNFAAIYRSDFGAAGYVISADATAAPGGGPLSVVGRPSRWDGGSHTLTIDYGSAHFVHIAEPTLTEAQALSIAKLIEVAPTLDNRSTWFDAAEALPLGG